MTCPLVQELAAEGPKMRNRAENTNKAYAYSLGVTSG
jgi:hypothetical protein